MPCLHLQWHIPPLLSCTASVHIQLTSLCILGWLCCIHAHCSCVAVCFTWFALETLCLSLSWSETHLTCWIWSCEMMLYLEVLVNWSWWASTIRSRIDREQLIARYFGRAILRQLHATLMKTHVHGLQSVAIDAHQNYLPIVNNIAMRLYTITPEVCYWGPCADHSSLWTTTMAAPSFHLET